MVGKGRHLPRPRVGLALLENLSVMGVGTFTGDKILNRTMNAYPLYCITNVHVQDQHFQHIWMPLPRNHRLNQLDRFEFEGVVVKYSRGNGSIDYGISRVEVKKIL